MENKSFRTTSNDLFLVDNSSEPIINLNLCLICFNNVKTQTLDPCQHKFCGTCLTSYLDLKISENLFTDLQCPVCSISISVVFLETILSETSLITYKNSINNNHPETDEENNILIGKSCLDLFWPYIILMIFMPIIFPFLIFFVFLLTVFNDKGIEDGFIRLFSKFWHRFIIYLVIFFLSPIIGMFLLVGGLIFIIFYFTYAVTKRLYPCFFVGVLLGVLMAGLSLFAGVLIILLGPLTGLFFLFVKVYFFCKK